MAETVLQYFTMWPGGEASVLRDGAAATDKMTVLPEEKTVISAGTGIG